MPRRIGSIFGLSFRTELFIMTYLGLVNSTLHWKSFQLRERLSQIYNLRFSSADIQFSNYVTSLIKKTLMISVVLEFILNVINPFTYLLNLYPTITWSRSDLLIPWLITHALRTIFLKILSSVLVFIFYFENMIPNNLLIEFFAVESINFLIAWYNWYLYIGCYWNIQKLDRLRILFKHHEEIMDRLNSLPETYSSFPNIYEIFHESSSSNNEFNELRLTRSLISLSENTYSSSDSTSLLLNEESLSVNEKSMQLLNFVSKDTRDKYQLKNFVNTISIYDMINNKKRNQILPNEESFEMSSFDLSLDELKSGCSCSNSEDEENIFFLISNKNEVNNNLKNKIININDSHQIINTESKILLHEKSKNKSARVQEDLQKFFLNILLLSSTSLMIICQNPDIISNINNFDFFTSKNCEYFYTSYPTLNIKCQIIFKDDVQKWLIFRHEFETYHDKNIFLNESKNKEYKKIDQ